MKRLACAALMFVAAPAWAQTKPAVPVLDIDEEAEQPEAENDVEQDDPAPVISDGRPPLLLAGYVDVGYVDAEGNGSSFPAGDERLPADYGVDAFAPAVNTRGDVASTDTNGIFHNGFLPRSANVGGQPSFLLNVAAFDLRYQPKDAPVMVFTRLLVLPRFVGGDRGEQSLLFMEQAFGRVTPFAGREIHLSVGKFDSVFGIEYLENHSPFRTGITPSLLARYTTGTSVGAKLFARVHAAPLWSSFSINAAATNSGNFVEALQPSHASLSGVPVGSARLGYELNLPHVQLKLGGSGLIGPRNDQTDDDALQRMAGVDARLYLFGLALSGEHIWLDERMGRSPKYTGAGTYPLASKFYARGFWAQAAYGLRVPLGSLRMVTIYGRYEQRHASFAGFRPIDVARWTGGLRFDLWQSVIVKAELLLNQEKKGAPDVDNDVFASSVVWSW